MPTGLVRAGRPGRPGLRFEPARAYHYSLRMAFLYILQSQTTGRYYVGSTNDLPHGVSKHRRSHSPATQGRGPWTLVYQESFPTLPEARRREYEIKSWKSSKLIAALIADKVG